MAAALLGQPRPLLSARQAETVDALNAHCPGFTTMRRLTSSFRSLLRVGKVATLHRWMVRAAATNISALERFVRTLRQDLGAVEGAVRERWSKGPVEGQINKCCGGRCTAAPASNSCARDSYRCHARVSADRRYGTAPLVRR